MLFLIVIGGIQNRNTKPVEHIDLGFNESDLMDLEGELENLEFEDLEGIYTEGVGEENVTLSFGLDDLEALEDLLEDLEFEDLEGLTEN